MRFDIELRKGAGAYICGEETALFNSIEGYRGEPRNKPPFPVDVGLFAKPTVVNNVESLINVLDIVLEGGAAFAGIGTEQSTGTRLLLPVRAASSGPACTRRRSASRWRALLEMAGGVAGGRPLQAVLLGGAAGGFVGPDQLDLELSFEATRAAGATLGSGVVMAFDDTVDLVPVLLRIAAFFRDESCGQCVPCRVGHRPPAGGAAATRRRAAAGQRSSRRARAARRDRPGDARRVDLRPRPDRGQRRRVGHPRAARLRAGGRRMSAVPVTIRRTVELQIDGEAVRVAEGATILDACRARGLDDPDAVLRRDADAGQRLPRVRGRGGGLARAGAVVRTEGRGRDGRPHPQPSGSTTAARWCSSSWVRAWISRRPEHVDRWNGEYGAAPERYGPPAPPAPAGARDRAQAGHHHAGDGQTAATVAQPVKVDNENYVRDYSKCILCYKCVEGCGTDWQNTFAIAVAGRGFDARIATEFAAPLPDSACVYCGNCIAVCPTGALMFKSEYDMRQAGSWDEAAQTVTETICSYCGVGCSLELHVQDNDIVKVTSPLDHGVTHGNLCVKGRFGFQYVQNRPPEANDGA